MLHYWLGTGQVMSGAWFPPYITLRIETKQLRFGFIRQMTVSYSLSALYVLFCKLQPCLHVSFTEGRLLSSHTAIKRRWWSVAVMVVFLEVCPVITQDLWTSARVTSGSWSLLLPKPFSSDLLSLARRPALLESWLFQTSCPAARL